MTSLMEYAAYRLQDTAKQWGRIRAKDPGESDSHRYQQLEHWFYCLTDVLGIERCEGEDLDSFIARIADWRDIHAAGRCAPETPHARRE
jgi:hypothetical protein